MVIIYKTLLLSRLSARNYSNLFKIFQIVILFNLFQICEISVTK